MTEEFEFDALEFLLDQMDAGRRAAFEQRLAHDPAAAAAFKSCADAFAGFACEAAPPEPMGAADQRLALGAILAATGEARPARPASGRGGIIPWPWPRYFWPIAAALLLAMNFIHFERPLQPLGGSDPAARVTQASDHPDETPAGDSIVALEGASPSVSSAEVSSASAPESPSFAAAGQSGKRSDELRRLEKLRSDYAELQRNTAVLRAEYDAVIRSLGGGVLFDPQAGRIAAMELVDAASYARGERKGLLDVARGILAEPGVVVADAGAPPPPGPSDDVDVTLGPSAPAEPGPSAASSPYAWAVFDDKEHRGYLNLYNLPAVATDQSLQLWVKTPDASTYQRVGEVPPQFQGGNGSLYYNLPPESAAPVEILITQELRAATPTAPTGPVVLRGP